VGGGAGGSIWLTAGVLAGTGDIIANGGAGDTDANSGGGRVAIYYGALNGFDPDSQIAAPGGGPLGCPGLLGASGTVYASPLTGLPALAVLSASTAGGVTRPWADYIDLTFNMAVDPATFTAADVVLTTPSGTLPWAQLTLSNLGGTRWRVSFPRQTTPGAYGYRVEPQIADLSGNLMPASYADGFNLSPTTLTNRLTLAPKASSWDFSIPSAVGFNYQLFRSTNLIDWESLGPITNGNGSVLLWSVPRTGDRRVFFQTQINDGP